MFDGWYTGIDGTGAKYIDTSACPAQASLKLYASWLRKVYDEDFRGYLSVDLNSQWRQSTSQTNPDPQTLLGVYESNSNYHVDNKYAKTYVRLSGYSEATIYIRSYAESSYDYTIAFNLDTDYTSTSVPSYNSAGVKAHTRRNQWSSQALTAYTEVNYTGIDPTASHFICVVYRKDGSASSGNDRGYLLVDAAAPYTLEQYDTHEMLETSTGVLATEGKGAAIKLEQYT